MRRFVLAAALCCAASGAARGDEFLDQLELARQAYEQGDYTAAAEELQIALQSLQDKLAQLYVQTFPEPPAGWTANPVESQTGAAFMGGGIALSRTYRGEGGATIEARVIANNPMMQGMAGLVAAMAARPGAKRLRIDRETAIVSFNATTGAGEAQLAVAGALIQLEGRKLASAEILETLLRSWDVAKLRELAD